jgi:putative peptidoglycan lipid II flippase
VKALLPGSPGKFDRKILRAAIIVGLPTLLGKIGATVKELVVATRFGRSDALDAFLIALALLLGLLAPYYLPYLGSGFTAAKLRLTKELLYILLPFLFFSGVAGSASALLNATEKFALPALAPLLTILVTILLVVCAPQQWGAVPLAGAVVAGSVLEAAVLVTYLGRQEIRWKPHRDGLTSELSRVLGQFFQWRPARF